jgi:hypothetical protein
MRYLLMICNEEREFNNLSEAQVTPVMAEYMALIDQLKAKGQYVSGARLQPVAAATSVRVRDGKRLVTDGPFAETREQLGGYFLVEAKDLDEAIDIAARIPGARFGTVEVRPIMEVPSGVGTEPAAASAVR